MRQNPRQTYFMSHPKKIYIYIFIYEYTPGEGKGDEHFAEGYHLGSLSLSYPFWFLPFHLPFPFHLVLHQTLGNEINSTFLRNWRASGVEDIFLGPPENSLFRVICFSIKVGYRRGRDEKKVSLAAKTMGGRQPPYL